MPNTHLHMHKGVGERVLVHANIAGAIKEATEILPPSFLRVKCDRNFHNSWSQRLWKRIKWLEYSQIFMLSNAVKYLGTGRAFWLLTCRWPWHVPLCFRIPLSGILSLYVGNRIHLASELANWAIWYIFLQFLFFCPKLLELRKHSETLADETEVCNFISQLHTGDHGKL